MLRNIITLLARQPHISVSKTMKLREKILLIVSITLLGLMAVVYTVSSTILVGSINKSEQNEAEQTVKGVLSLLDQTQENFTDRFADWSAWDDAYNFIQDGNKSFIESNLPREALANLKINLMLFINNSGEIVYGTGFELKNGAYQPVPPALRDRLAAKLPSDRLLQQPDRLEKRTGILLLPSGPMWITSQPILTSKGSGPLRGTLIVGRRLDAEAIAQLARIARLPITIYPVTTSQLPADFQAMRSALSEKTPISVQPIDENKIGGYSLINDFDGKPALILRVDISRETYQQTKKSLQYLVGFLLLSGVIFAAVACILLERSVLSRIAYLISGISRIRAFDDLSLRLSVSGRDEISDLTITINKMLQVLESSQEQLQLTLNQLATANQDIAFLNERLQEENIRLTTEISITRQLQQMILPKEWELRQIDELDIAGFMEPANEVGGDYYDVLYSNDSIKIAIGDVTGHGLESGVLMIMVQTAVRTLLANNETDPVKFLSAINRTIYGNVQRMNSDKNLTLSLLDYQNGNLRLSGQHEEMIIVRQGGKIELIDTIDLGFPIGLEADITDFVTYNEMHLQPGDVIVLYTDGITEAENIQGVQYGLERLCHLVSQNCQLSANGIRQAVLDDLWQHIGQQKIFDDITLLVLKYKGTQPSEANND